MNCCPVPFSPSQLSPPPPSPVWIRILYTRIQCVRGGGGGYGVLGPREIKICPKVPLQVNFFKWRHFAVSLVFLHFICFISLYNSGLRLVTKLVTKQLLHIRVEETKYHFPFRKSQYFCDDFLFSFQFRTEVLRKQQNVYPGNSFAKWKGIFSI